MNKNSLIYFSYNVVVLFSFFIKSKTFSEYLFCCLLVSNVPHSGLVFSL